MHSVFCDVNQWGYEINVNHPKVAPLYEKYKKRRGIIGAPSAEERLRFEGQMKAYIDAHPETFREEIENALS